MEGGWKRLMEGRGKMKGKIWGGGEGNYSFVEERWIPHAKGAWLKNSSKPLEVLGLSHLKSAQESGKVFHQGEFCRYTCTCIHILYVLTTWVRVRYYKTFHEPKASEISRHISHKKRVVRNLSIRNTVAIAMLLWYRGLISILIQNSSRYFS